MKILQVNKFWYPRGGAEHYVLALSKQLRERGHTVVEFGMHHHLNIRTAYDDYFVSELDLKKRGGIINALHKLGRVVYSTEAKRKFSKLLVDEAPDVIHIHNIYHQLSPSILLAARRARIPVIMTAHDYKITNPNYRMFHRGQICEHSSNGSYWEALRYRCMDSWSASFAVMIESYLHGFLGSYRRAITRIVSPSSFLVDLAVERGAPARWFVKVPTGIQPPPQPKSTGPERVVYFGRLSEEKGLKVLLDAAKMARTTPFTVVGRGPLEAELRSRAGELGLKNIEFKGFLKGEDLWSVVASAKAVVVPTLSYENYPLSVLEAQALGTVVIASAIGGLPEQIVDGQTGFLVPPGDAVELAKAVERVMEMDEGELAAMQAAARERVLTINSSEDHLRRIEALYKSVCVEGVHRDKPLRIAVIGAKGYPPAYGGVEQHVAALGRVMADNGHKVAVYSRSWYGSAQKKDDPVKSIRLWSPHLKGFDTLYHSLVSTLHVLLGDYDVVAVHGVGPALFAFLIRLFSRAKVVVTVHSLNRLHPGWGFFARLWLRLGEWAAARFAHQTIVVSRDLRSYFRGRYKKARINFIPNGVRLLEEKPSATLLEPWGLTEGRFIVVIARLVASKHVHTALKAYLSVPAGSRGDWKMVIVGDQSFSSDYVSELKKMAGKDKSVVFTGWQEGQALRALTAHAGVFLSASEAEGLPLALLEASAFGVGALVSDIPPHREIVKNESARFAVGDTVALAALMQRLFADPQWFAQEGQKNKKLVYNEYRWDAVAQKTLQLYYDTI